ncbi:MAG: hypothetical protein M1839_009586 [Geoglossum umbratile]|nr:MAG: hypothetical protein M1839_009586 [Geoglossum umbratile]
MKREILNENGTVTPQILSVGNRLPASPKPKQPGHELLSSKDKVGDCSDEEEEDEDYDCDGDVAGDHGAVVDVIARRERALGGGKGTSVSKTAVV